MFRTTRIALALLVVPASVSAGTALSLTADDASRLAGMALECVEREFPNKPGHVINDETDVRRPRDMHPVFYGCYDWHSSVHGHWTLVRTLRRFPDLPEAPRIRAALNRNITSDGVLAEVAYLGQPNRKSFERTYGWAWLLKLAEELHAWDDPDARRWSEYLQPLTRAIVERYLDFMPRQTYPIRTGVHPNTAFGIAFALDYARATGDGELEELLVERSRAYFGGDTDYPVAWEPGGEDFFSPALMEADLMRRVMEPGEFAAWLDAFLPGLGTGTHGAIMEPAVVSDRTDPKIVHLDGLNLSRAWCMFGVASALRSDDPRRQALERSAERHARDALAQVASGHYEGQHWLGSFALYMLTAAGD